MKILHVTSHFYPALAYGGSAPVAYNIAKELARRGHEVTVWTTDAFDQDHRLSVGFEEVDGIQVRRFRNLSNSLAFRQKIFLPTGMIAFARKYVKDFDIIHCHELRALPSALVGHYAQRHKVPYVMHFHGSVGRSRKKILKHSFDLLIGRRVLLGAERFFAIYYDEVKQLVALGADRQRIDVIPNAIDLQEYSDPPSRGLFRTKYGIPQHEKVVLYVGRLHPDKGLDLLVHGFSLLLKEMPNARLVIVGQDDGYGGALKELIQRYGVAQQVLLTGFVQEEDKLAAYRDSDVFFSHSSTRSPLLTFLEAWASGLPLITTSTVDLIMSPQEFHGKAGYIIPYDAQALRSALYDIMHEESLRVEMGRTAKRLAETWLNWSSVTDVVEAKYYETLGDRGKMVVPVAPDMSHAKTTTPQVITTTAIRKRPLRVLVTSTEDLGKALPRRAHHLVNYLCQNHDVTALCMNAWWLTRPDGQPLFDEPYYRGSFPQLNGNLRLNYLSTEHISPLRQQLRAGSAIKQVLSQNGPQHFDVHVSFNSLRAGQIAARKLRAVGVPTLLDVNVDIPAVVRISSHLPVPARPAGRIAGKYLLNQNVRLAQRVTYITRTLAAAYKLPSGKSELLPNGVDSLLFCRTDASQLRSELGLRGKFVLGHVGLLRQWVDLDTALIALASISQERPDLPVSLLLVGGLDESFPLSELIQRYGVADRVVAIPPVPYTEVPRYINCMDVCLAPRKVRLLTLREMPMKIFEYMACEKPVVATNLLGVRELAGDRVLYAFYPEEFKRHIIRLYEDAEFARNLATSGRHFVVENYSWERISRCFEDLLVELTEGKPRAGTSNSLNAIQKEA